MTTPFDPDKTDTDPILLPGTPRNVNAFRITTPYGPVPPKPPLPGDASAPGRPSRLKDEIVSAMMEVRAIEREEQQRQAQLDAAAAAEAAEAQQKRDEEEELANRYNKPYFWTKIIMEAAAPAMLIFAIILLAWLIDAGAIELFAQDVSGYINPVAVVAVVVCGWWFARSYVLAKKSRPQADRKMIQFYEPRIPILGLLGNNPRFPTNQAVINVCRPSFWNFLPGWNSWVLELDTGAQHDEKIQRITCVRDGDQLAHIISPGFTNPKQKRGLGLKLKNPFF